MEPLSNTTVSLPCASSGQERYVDVMIQQFPFVPAVASTVYKVQGETLDLMIVVGWKSSHAIVYKPQQTYLLFSRATSRNAFLLSRL